jgi:hypothetical protein
MELIIKKQESVIDNNHDYYDVLLNSNEIAVIKHRKSKDHFNVDFIGALSSYNIHPSEYGYGAWFPSLDTAIEAIRKFLIDLYKMLSVPTDIVIVLS